MSMALAKSLLPLPNSLLPLPNRPRQGQSRIRPCFFVRSFCITHCISFFPPKLFSPSKWHNSNDTVVTRVIQRAHLPPLRPPPISSRLKSTFSLHWRRTTKTWALSTIVSSSNRRTDFGALASAAPKRRWIKSN